MTGKGWRPLHSLRARLLLPVILAVMPITVLITYQGAFMPTSSAQSCRLGACAARVAPPPVGSTMVGSAKRRRS